MKPLEHLRGYLQRPLVRPWALAGPVLVLIVCLPLLHPLREPDWHKWHDQQQMLASTIQAVVEQHSLAIDKSVFAANPVVSHNNGHIYSPYPPMFAVLMAPFYWVLLKQGLAYGDNPIFVQYVLTFIGASLPAAMCVGLVYRLARLFELQRPLRVALGVAAVATTGILSYSVVLSSYVPAALLLLLATSFISHLAVSNRPSRRSLLAVLAGFSAALAAAIDPPAVLPAILLCSVLLAMRWSGSMRASVVLLYILGAAPVVLLNISLLLTAGIPLRPSLMGEMPTAMPQVVGTSGDTLSAQVKQVTPLPDELDDGEPTGVVAWWNRISGWIGRILERLIGSHGVLSHYPAIVLGIIGATLALHRHWIATTKALAVIVIIASLLLVVAYAFRDEPRDRSYSAVWFLSISPLVMLWSGVWLKRHHRPQSWVLAGIAAGFGLVVTAVGMTNPMPRDGYSGYSFADAAMHLIGKDHSQTTPPKR